MNYKLRTNNGQSSIVNRQSHGFTLTELLIALMVGSIVLAAAAAMASAMSNGKAATERMSRSAAYLSQLGMRLSDAAMRAESITARAGGVELGYAGGQTLAIYTDDTKRIVFEDSGGGTAYYSEPSQANVVITAVSADRMSAAFDLVENGQSQTYRMTIAKRGGT